jgi:hypothetical protein
MKSIFVGFVALVVGGVFGPFVEVYSPEGKCQHRLTEIPIGGTKLHYPVLALIDEQIFACAGFSDGNGTVMNLLNLLNYLKLCCVFAFYPNIYYLIG